ncbi:MAG: hypothetical protein D6E12_07345 [Desulfovibrio sp.]|nr:MAG: hypothetical protein D6E12_07345 [Desulfovibrio sp.]
MPKHALLIFLLATLCFPALAMAQDTDIPQDVPAETDANATLVDANATVAEGNATAAPPPPPGPDDVLAAFFADLTGGVVSDLDKADLLVVELKRKYFVAQADYLDMADFAQPELVLALYGLNGPLLTFVDMEFTVEEQEGDSAVVRVAYDLRVSLESGESLQGEKEDRLVPMAREDGQWKIVSLE